MGVLARFGFGSRIQALGLRHGSLIFVGIALTACPSPEGYTPTPTQGAAPTQTAQPTTAETTGTAAVTDTPLATAPATATASLEPSAAPSPSPTATRPPPTPTPITSTCPEEGAPDALHCGVEVRLDPRGTPHIYAESEHDLFFVQGWLAGHERLFQIEDNRLRALGRRAELFGESRLGDDLFMRSLKMEAYGAEELIRWETAYPRELRWLKSYIAGLNAYLLDAADGSNGARLPESFTQLGYEPEPFEATQFMAMDRLFALSLGPDPGLELTITLIKLVLPAPMFKDLLRTAPMEAAFTTVDAMTEVEPGGPRPPFPGGGQRGEFPPVEADLDWMASLDPALAAHLKTLVDEPEERAALASAIPGILEMTERLLGRASNGWVVHGEHTQTGSPLLANDAHVGVSLPNQFHQMHLNTRDAGGALDMMGLCLAGLPGVVFGHNRWIGWGVTTSFFDMADLYLEVPSPQDPGGAVMFNGQSVPIESRDETFVIRADDGSNREEVHALKWIPHHGAVMPAAALGLPEELVVSIRWTGFQAGTVAGTVLGFNQARSLDRVKAIMDDHRIGAGNWHFASTEGDIAYDPRVRLPVREGLSTLNPPWSALPGSGGYEWSTQTPWIPEEGMPHIYNPAAGFAVTANNDPTGTTADNDPINDEYYYGATFASGMRAQRVTDQLSEWIRGEHAMTADDMRTLQKDNYSKLAERLIPYLLDAAERRPELLSEEGALAIEILKAWDFDMGPDSLGAGLYLSWWPLAILEIFMDDVGEDIGGALFGSFNGDIGQFLARPLLHFLDATANRIDQIDGGGRFPSASGTNYFDDLTTPETLETRDEQLIEAFELGVANIAAYHGSDMSTWTWSSMHSMTMRNPQSRWLPDLSRGPYPVSGYGFSVNCTEGTQIRDGMPPGVFPASKVSAYRQVMDFSDGQIQTTNVLLGGQYESGASEHYDDQVEPWLDFATIPQAFEREEVVADAKAVWHMPAGFPGVNLEVQDSGL